MALQIRLALTIPKTDSPTTPNVLPTQVVAQANTAGDALQSLRDQVDAIVANAQSNLDKLAEAQSALNA